MDVAKSEMETPTSTVFIINTPIVTTNVTIITLSNRTTVNTHINTAVEETAMSVDLMSMEGIRPQG